MKIKIPNYEIAESKTKLPDESRGLQDLQRRVRIYRGLCVILSVLSLILLIVVGVLGTARQSQTMCHDEKAIPGVMKQDPKFLSASCSPQECRQVCRVKGYLASPRKYCDFGWQEFEGTCFYISRDMCTWAKGREECRNMDGDLAVVTNQRLQEFLIKKGNLAYWIGVIQTKTGETVWVNATVAQSYWGQSQLEGRCGYLIGGDNPAGTWHLSPCSYQTAYICQK